MILNPLHAVRRARHQLAFAIGLMCLAAEAEGAVWLSSYSFTTDNLPYIYTNASLSSPYRLRAKISGNYHATNGWNNHGGQLESVPGPGTYTIELYWVQYDSDWSTLFAIQNPFDTYTINIQAPNSGPVPTISVDGYSYGNTITRPGPSGSTSITVHYGASDSNGNLSGIRYNVWNSTTGYFDNGGGGYISQSGSSGQVVRTVNLDSDGEWYFWTDAIDTSGAATSTGAWGAGFRLRVQQPPQSNSVSGTNALAGHPTTLTGSATDPNGNLAQLRFYINAPPNYPGWSIDAGTANINGSAATGSVSWQIPASASAGTYYVHVRAIDADGAWDWNGNVMSSFTVSAPEPPAITTQPSSQTVNAGQPVTLTVGASGSAPLSYQWRKDGANISGANNSSHAISNTQSTDAGGYSVVVSNSVGSVASNTAALTVNAVAPAITAHPSSQAVNAGQQATFSVSASGSAPLSYQWRKNGGNISGANSSSYTISSAQSADAGGYSVVVSNSAGSVTSNTADLAVNLVAPTITSQPASQTINSGQPVTFSVSASGATPLSYQWRKNGANIGGANGSSYSISNVQTSDAASYSVIVSNSVGAATSNGATLTVTTLQPIRLAVKYWRADDYPNRPNGGHYENVWVAEWRSVDEYDEHGNWTGSHDEWFEGWESQWVDHYAADGIHGSTWTTSAGTFDINTGASGYSASTANRGHFLHIYQPGQLVTFHVHGTAPSGNCNDYTWALYDPWGGQMTGNWFSGAYAWSFHPPWAGIYRIDVTYYNANATPGSATVSYYIPVGVTPPPTINTQPSPASQTVASGATVTYSVAATGATGYQWKKEGVAIGGANSATLTLANVQPSASGSYAVDVSNNGGTVTSNAVSLTVSQLPPAITTQPASLARNAGQSATFSVVASGSAPLSYQWRKNGTNISGATNSSWAIASAQSGDAGTYSVVVSNSVGSVTSSDATLTVTAVAPTISSHPSSQTVNAGQSVTFTVAATGTTPLSYQWRKNGANIGGASGASYAIASVQAGDAASYTVVVTNTVGSATSNAASLTVNTTAPIRLALQYWQMNDFPNRGLGTGHYETQQVWVDGQDVEDGYYEWSEEEGQDVWVHTGWHYEPGHYEWQSVWVEDTAPDGLYGSRWDTTVGTFGHPLTYATGAFDPAAVERGHLLNGYQASQKVTFRAWAYAPAGNCNSYQALLANPSGTIIASSGLFSSGSYWEHSFHPPASGVYRVTISFSNATATTPASGWVSYYIPVGVGSPPTITVPPGPATQTVSAGASVSYSVTASNATSYQWWKNGTPITGAASATLTLTNVQPADNGDYTVAVGNNFGTTTSIAAKLTVTAIPPTISTQPVAQTITAGQNATFTVAASGTAPLSYQWRKGGVALANGGAIGGATSATLALTGAAVADAGSYDVVVSNDVGSATSASAALTVNTPPPGTGIELLIHRP